MPSRRIRTCNDKNLCTSASQSGFTLLELMIAVSIMAVIVVFTQQTIQSALKARVKIQQQIAEDANVLSALRLIQNDIAMAFHFRDINLELTQEKPPPPPLGSEVPPPPPITPENTFQPLTKANAAYITQFQGKSNELYLSTTSHYRTARDSKESDYAVVGYYLKPCKSSNEKNAVATQCLWRKINFYPDLDITRGGTESVVIENVEDLKLKYLGEKQRELMDRWSSGPNGEDFSRGQFPVAVEVELRVKRAPLRTSNKNAPQKPPPSIVRKILVPIRFPNNPVPNTQPGNPTDPSNTNGVPVQESEPQYIPVEQ